MLHGTRVARLWRSLVATLWLSGCGGGVFVGFHSGGVDSPPSVNLTTAVTSVPAGLPVRFVAAAADDNGVEQVAFYRVDPGGSTLLVRDFSAPYEWTVTAPADGRTTLSVFARAADHDGNVADSAPVTVDIVPR